MQYSLLSTAGRPTRWWLPLALAVFYFGMTYQANACDYCVREVGFVPLHHAPYQVIITVSEVSPPSERLRLTEQARAAIQPSNVIVRLGTPRDGGLFADAAGQITGPLPVAVVYAPDGRFSVLGSGRELDDASSTAGWIHPLVHSPAREGLGEVLLNSFGKVVLVEGGDESANRAAREIAARAIEQINSVKTGFDRLIEIGPSLQIISARDYAAERWLLWSLGIEPNSQPHVAVLYGRGLRLGDVLDEDQLTQKKLYTMLSFLARDCECDLDRDWLYGHAIPLSWEDGLRRQAYDVLGFDPESAATRAEVARILARGPHGPRGQVHRDPFADAVSHTAFPGLTIHHLDADDSVVPPAPTQPAEMPESTSIPEAVSIAAETTTSDPQSIRTPAARFVVPDPNTAWRTTQKIVATMVGLVLLGSVAIVICARTFRANREGA